MTTGLFIGRFQPFHNGHLHLIKEALNEIEHLLIGIGSSREVNKEKNPYSYVQRKEMVEAALQGNNITNYSIHEIPDFPDDSDWIRYIKENLTEFDIVFMSDKNTAGEQWVENCLKKDCIIKKIPSLKGVDATTIRKLIKEKKGWKHLVPEEVVECMKN
jgi:nicotinamide-nucleotide adenylyltransferase